MGTPITNEKRTVDSVLQFFEDAAHEKMVVTPSQWVDAGLLLNAMMGEEHAKYAELEHQVALIVSEHLQNDRSAAYAKAMAKASPLYKEMVLQKAKCDRVVEFIRLAKRRATMTDSELRV